MRSINDIFNTKLDNTIVTLGKFDGSHIGHQLLFDTAISLKKDDLKTVIFTFDLPPQSVCGERAGTDLKTIMTRDEANFRQYEDRIDYIVFFPVNKETMSMSPEKFVRDILCDRLGVKTVVVGEDFRFGKGRSGDVALLRQLGKEMAFDVVALKKVTYRLSGTDREYEVSSTLIKEEILKGNLDDVTAMLGHPFSIKGRIVHGKHFGSVMGFPTINFEARDNKILPPDGVYATFTEIDGSRYLSVTNIGSRPTFDDGEHRTVETNILYFNRDVYGREAEVFFKHFIRNEKKFNSMEELKAQIEEDKESVKKFYSCDLNC